MPVSFREDGKMHTCASPICSRIRNWQSPRQWLETQYSWQLVNFQCARQEGNTIEPVSSNAVMQQMLFQSCGDCRLSRSRQTGQPNRDSLLATIFASLFASKSFMPGNISIAPQVSQLVPCMCQRKPYQIEAPEAPCSPPRKIQVDNRE